MGRMRCIRPAQLPSTHRCSCAWQALDPPPPPPPTARRRRVATLIAGDVVAFLAFAAIGRATHHEALWAAETFSTAAPFIIGEAGAPPAAPRPPGPAWLPLRSSSQASFTHPGCVCCSRFHDTAHSPPFAAH